jgi:hypothetical protein
MNIPSVALPAVLIILVSYGISNAQDVVLYGAASDDCVNSSTGSTDSSLYLVDPNTAETERIGGIGFEGVTGLAFVASGLLVGSAKGETTDNPKFAVLISINPGSAEGSLIGTIGEDNIDGECARAPDLTYDRATGTLFATGDNCSGGDYLQFINQTTGHGTLIGSYDPFNGGGNGLAISDNGVLFVTANEAFITVNRDTGAPTFIGNLPLPEGTFVNSLAFHPVTGELFGSTIAASEDPAQRTSTLVKINTTTGDTTEIGELPNCFDALIFAVARKSIPALSERAAIAAAGVLGIFGLLALRRRKAVA